MSKLSLLPFAYFSLALIIYFVIHSLLANEKVKFFFYNKGINRRSYRLFYNFIALGLLVPIYFFYVGVPRFELWEKGPTTIYLGWCLILLGLIITLLALRQYDLGEFSGWRQYRTINQAQAASLQTSGLNRFVRHPLYFGSLLMLWGFFLHQAYLSTLLVALISSIYLVIGTRLEEQKLVRQFGEAYLDYQQQVPMLWPRFKH